MVFSRAQLSDEDKERIDKRRIKINRVADILAFVLSAILFIFCLKDTIFVGVGVLRTVLWGILAASLLAGVIKGRKSFIIFTLTVNFIALAFVSVLSLYTFGFHSVSKWKYNAQRKYVDRKHNGNSDCFPDKLPDDIEDYSIDYMPSIMQGTGHFRVRFRTSAEQIEKYEKEYSEKAIYTIPLKDFGGEFIINVQEFSPEAVVSYENDKSLDVAYSQTFWEGHENEATVYVTSAVHDWNHPHSGAVIINRSKCMIEFTQLG